MLFLFNQIITNESTTDFNNSTNIEQRIHKPVEVWIRGFMNAEFVITDSFHACVFSILFHKPFVAIGNSGRGLTRFTSLLKNLLGRKIVYTIAKLSVYQDNTKEKRNVSNFTKTRS